MRNMSEAKTSRRNLLLIVADCLRADRCPVGPGSDELRFWPSLNSNGAVFTQAIASASNTPVCFGSLLTGHYSFVHGIRSISGPKLNPQIPTLQGTLGRHGYATYAFVTGPMLDLFGIEAGFDEYEHRQRSQNIYTSWGEELFERFKAGRFDRPWFVLLHLFELHHPRELNGLEAPYRSMQEYDLAWRQLDSRLSELLRHVPPETTIVLTADHGEQVGRRSDRTLLGHVLRKLRQNLRLPRRSDDWRHHGFHVFDGLLRIPLCISGGVDRGVVDQPVRQIDVMPTLLEVLDVPLAAPTAGRSLLPLIRGESAEQLPAYVESGRDDAARHWHGLREAAWKYVEHPRWGRNIDAEPALFDLTADPAETRNVIRQHPEVAIGMRRELDRIVHQAAPAESAAESTMDTEEQARLYEQLRSLGYVD